VVASRPFGVGAPVLAVDVVAVPYDRLKLLCAWCVTAGMTSEPGADREAVHRCRLRGTLVVYPHSKRAN
jgi:hypothetical protein